MVDEYVCGTMTIDCWGSDGLLLVLLVLLGCERARAGTALDDPAGAGTRCAGAGAAAESAGRDSER